MQRDDEITEAEIEKYVLTPLGCAQRSLVEYEGRERAEFLARMMLDALELHMMRHYQKDGGNGAIILDGNSLTFGTVARAEVEDAA